METPCWDVVPRVCKKTYEEAKKHIVEHLTKEYAESRQMTPDARAVLKDVAVDEYLFYFVCYYLDCNKCFKVIDPRETMVSEDVYPQYKLDDYMRFFLTHRSKLRSEFNLFVFSMVVPECGKVDNDSGSSSTADVGSSESVVEETIL